MEEGLEGRRVGHLSVVVEVAASVVGRPASLASSMVEYPRVEAAEAAQLHCRAAVELSFRQQVEAEPEAKVEVELAGPAGPVVGPTPVRVDQRACSVVRMAGLTERAALVLTAGEAVAAPVATFGFLLALEPMDGSASHTSDLHWHNIQAGLNLRRKLELVQISE